MSTPAEIYDELKGFLDFGDQDAARLQALGPIFAKHGASITDDFYVVLGKNPETAKLIEGRVDALKATHARWMAELFTGDYGEGYFNGRMRIGMVHVKVGLSPYYVEATMTHIRNAAERIIHQNVSDRGEATASYNSLLKLLDLDLMVINLAYQEERLDLLTKVTGMKRGLLENLIKQGQKKK